MPYRDMRDSHGSYVEPSLVLMFRWPHDRRVLIDSKERQMAENMTRDELVARLVRAGELQVSGQDQAELDTYFAVEEFRFHGPDGFESDYAGLTDYFASIRAASDGRSIRRGIMLVDGHHVACQT